MGRMLDALKNRDAGSTKQLSDTKEPPQVAPEIVTEWSLGDNDVPFVEVGPGRTLSGSPQVLAAGPPLRISNLTTAPSAPPATARPQPAQPSAVQPPHPQTGQGLARGTVLSAQMLEPRGVSATLEPMNGLYEIGKIASEIVAYHDPNHPISQQYAQLVEQLLQSESGKALLLSGIRSGVGTSTVLLNLAVTVAMRSNRNVTIIDANRRQPTLASRLGIKPPAFLQDVLSGSVALTDALLRSPLPKLALLAVSATHPEVALGVEAFAWVLATLKQRNDLVLIDGPSLDQKDEVSPLVSLVDSMFLVTPQGEPAATSRPLFQLVSRFGGRLRGLLHTQMT